MFKISDVVLANGLIHTDAFSAQMVDQTVLRTLGGRAYFYEAGRYEGIPITLESGEDTGIQTLETVNQLWQLYSVPEANYLLEFGPRQYSVKFRHSDPPAFEATPVIARSVPQPGDYFFVKIKLITL